KKHTYLTNDINWDVERFHLSWDGKTIAFVTNEDGRSVLHLFDTARQKEVPRPKIPAGFITSLRWHKNNRDLGLTITSPRNPPDVYSLDAQSGSLEQWTFSETGRLNTRAFPEPELVRWKSFDERMISGWLYTPPQKFNGKRPVI